MVVARVADAAEAAQAMVMVARAPVGVAWASAMVEEAKAMAEVARVLVAAVWASALPAATTVATAMLKGSRG